MSALLGSLEGAAGAGGLTGLVADSVMGDLKNDASGVDGNTPWARLLATPRTQSQAQAPMYNFPQMPSYDQSTGFVGNVGSTPISQYFVGGKS